MGTDVIYGGIIWSSYELNQYLLHAQAIAQSYTRNHRARGLCKKRTFSHNIRDSFFLWSAQCFGEWSFVTCAISWLSPRP